MFGIMKSGCLPLQKWSPDDYSLLIDIPADNREMDAQKSFQENELILLGVPGSYR